MRCCSRPRCGIPSRAGAAEAAAGLGVSGCHRDGHRTASQHGRAAALLRTRTGLPAPVLARFRRALSEDRGPARHVGRRLRRSARRADDRVVRAAERPRQQEAGRRLPRIHRGAAGGPVPPLPASVPVVLRGAFRCARRGGPAQRAGADSAWHLPDLARGVQGRVQFPHRLRRHLRAGADCRGHLRAPCPRRRRSVCPRGRPVRSR